MQTKTEVDKLVWQPNNQRQNKTDLQPKGILIF